MVIFKSRKDCLRNWVEEDAPTNADRCEALLVVDNRLLFLGRQKAIDGSKVCLWQRISQQDGSSATFIWRRVTDFPGEAMQSMAVALAKGKLVVAGGQDKDLTSLSDVFAYDFCDGTWSEWPSLPRALNGAALVQFEDKLLLLAGRSRVDGALRSNSHDVQEINLERPQDSGWGHHPSHPHPSHGPGVVAIGDQLIIAGGRGEHSDVTSVVHFWNKTTDRWSRLPSLHKATVLGSLLCSGLAG